MRDGNAGLALVRYEGLRLRCSVHFDCLTSHSRAQKKQQENVRVASAAASSRVLTRRLCCRCQQKRDILTGTHTGNAHQPENFPGQIFVAFFGRILFSQKAPTQMKEGTLLKTHCLWVFRETMRGRASRLLIGWGFLAHHTALPNALPIFPSLSPLLAQVLPEPPTHYTAAAFRAHCHGHFQEMPQPIRKL